MDTTPAGPHPFVPFLTTLAAQIQAWVDNGLDPHWICLLTATYLTQLVPDWGNKLLFSSLNISPSPAVHPAPSPSEELRLLRTSFDLAFTSLAGQVKELVTKVNGSGPPQGSCCKETLCPTHP